MKSHFPAILFSAFFLFLQISCSVTGEVELVEEETPVLPEPSPGELDLSFNGIGYVTRNNTAGTTGDDLAKGVITDRNNNIYATGTSYDGTSAFMTLWKCKEDGTPDASFGDNGVVVSRIQGGSEYSQEGGEDLVTDSQGNILVIGYFSAISGNTTSKAYIWKYTPGGALMTTFGNNGILVIDLGDRDERFEDIELDAHDNIFIVGSYNNKAAILKFDSRGVFCQDFGVNGVSTGFRTGVKFVALAIAPGGAIYCTGYDYLGYDSTDDMLLMKFNSDGTVDTSFGSSGYVTHDNAVACSFSGDDRGECITLDDSENIYIGGYSGYWYSKYFSVWKCTSDGSLDTSFGQKGFVSLYRPPSIRGASYANDITLDSSNYILLTGLAHDMTYDDMIIWKFLPDGTLDPRFGTDGMVTHDNAAQKTSDFTHDFGQAIHLDNKGRIIVAGSSWGDTGIDMAIWRYIN